jgi:4-amino-4-deoxy-L-arabinose transferase-like glycosyltransferase
LRMPGFPALLAVPRLVWGNDPVTARFPARILLALVGVLACGLTYWLGRELGGEVVGLIAGTYTVFSPTMLIFSVLFLSETAFAAALLGSLIAIAKLVRALATTPGRRHHWLAFLCGVLIGIATYMRPTWLLVGPGIAVLLVLLGKSSWSSRFCEAALLCLGLALTMLPWTARNAYVTGHWIPTTLWVGPSLYDGLHPGATGDSDMTFFETDKLLESMSEYEMNREYERRAKQYALSHPGRAVWLAFVKQLRYWNPAPQSVQVSGLPVTLMKIIAWLAFLPLIIGSLVGAWFSRRDPWLLILTAAPIIYFALLHLLFVGSLRYRLPAEYPLAVLAAIGFVRIFRLNGRSRPVGSLVFSDR